MNKKLAIVLVGIASCLILVLLVAFVFLIQEALPGSSGEQLAENTAVATAETESVAAVPTDTLEPTDLPAPVVTEAPTETAVPPTAAPTDTPEATATPEASATPEPTATATNAPVVVQPTNTPVPPTNTPAPTSPPVNTNGLSASFTLRSDSSYTVNGNIWFDFTITNSTGQNVPYQALGALPKKDGVIRGDLFKQSWGGPNATIKPEGLSATDWIKLPETGNYTLQLAICFDALSACQSGASAWVGLSPEIPVTIN